MTAPKDKDGGLTLDQLKASYSYDPETGLFERLKKINQAGERAGWLNPVTGYLLITVLGRRYMAHRLAWFYVHGVWPSDRLDHKNLVKSDNRFCNLREATEQQNMRNRPILSNNSLGIKGVRLHEGGNYQARIFDGKRFRTKTFTRLDDAVQYHSRLSREVFGDFARVA